MLTEAVEAVPQCPVGTCLQVGQVCHPTISTGRVADSTMSTADHEIRRPWDHDQQEVHTQALLAVVPRPPLGMTEPDVGVGKMTSRARHPTWATDRSE